MNGMIRIKVKQEDMPKTRSMLTVNAIQRKGGKMRDRRMRRAKDARHSWRNEE
jgi:hypothetical protein